MRFTEAETDLLVENTIAAIRSIPKTPWSELVRINKVYNQAVDLCAEHYKLPQLRELVYFSTPRKATENYAMCNQQCPNRDNTAGATLTNRRAGQPTPIDWTAPIQMDDGRPATYLGELNPKPNALQVGRIVRVTNLDGSQVIIVRDVNGSAMHHQAESLSPPSASRVINVPKERKCWLRVLRSNSSGGEYRLLHDVEADAYAAPQYGFTLLAIIPITWKDGDGLWATK